MKRLSELLSADGKNQSEIDDALSAEVKTFMGEDLKKPILYKFDPLQYESIPEAKESKDWFGDKDIFEAVNRQKFVAAKTSSMQSATKELREIYETTPEFQLKNLMDSIKTAHKDWPVDKVRATAESILKA